MRPSQRGERRRRLAVTSAQRPGASRTVGSGVRMYGGVYSYDKATALASLQLRADKMREMSETDAHVVETLRTATLPLWTTATWSVRPGDDNERGKEVADFAGAVLYGLESQRFGSQFKTYKSWVVRLNEIMNFLRDGFAVFYKGWRIVDDKLIPNLIYLHPETITKWNPREDGLGLKSIERQYAKPTGGTERETLKAEELALYGWQVTGDRWEGVPFIRSLFGPWSRKDFFLRCKMIAASRAAIGIPWAKWKAEDADTGFDTEIENFLDEVVRAELEGTYFHAGVDSLELGYLQQPPQQLEKYDALVKAEDLALAHGGGTKHLMLGEDSGGSRAVGDVQQSERWIIPLAVATIICEQEREGVGGCSGVLADLVEYNFADVEKIPRLRAKGVDPQSRKQDVRLILECIKAGMPDDVELWRDLAERLGLELSEETYKRWKEDLEKKRNQPPPNLAVAPFGQQPKDKPLPGRDDLDTGTDNGKQNASPRDRARSEETRGDVRAARRLQFELAASTSLRMPAMLRDDARARGFGRPPSEFEVVACSLPAVRAAFDEGAQRLGGVLRRAYRQMIEDLVGRVRSGKVTRASLAGIATSQPAKVKQMTEDARQQFISTVARGKEHLTDELQRQQTAARGQKRPQAFARKLWQRPEQQWDAAVRVVLDELVDDARFYAGISIGQIWARLTGLFIDIYTRMTDRGLTSEALLASLEAELNALSENPVLDIGRQLAAVAYNYGRDVGAREALAANRAFYVVRSEVMDTGTCESCAAMDGAVFEIGSPEYEEHMPPNDCEGGERCRGFLIAIDVDYAAATALEE